MKKNRDETEMIVIRYLRKQCGINAEWAKYDPPELLVGADS